MLIISTGPLSFSNKPKSMLLEYEENIQMLGDAYASPAASDAKIP